MYSPADLLSTFLTGAIVGAIGMLFVLAAIGRKQSK